MRLKHFHQISSYLFLLLSIAVLSGCTKKNPLKIWETFNQEIARMRESEANYVALKREHEKLKKEFFLLEHEHNALLAEMGSKQQAEKSLQATGSKQGLAPEMIDYKVPGDINADGLLSLAYEHMREKRFAPAAATFEKLFSSPEGAAFQDADALYAAGVAWYEVKNFHKALESFQAAKGYVHGGEKESIRKKVDLWQRVIERRLASVKEKGEH